MKVLYFFDILEGNFMKCYIKLKKKEIEEKIASLRQIYKGIKISVYCLNKEKFFLCSKNFNESLNSVLNEYFRIERNTYNDLVNSVWSNVKKSFENLTKNRLNVLNNFWSIFEYKITTEFIYVFEKFEFIKSIIKREKPDIIYISQKDKYFYKFLKKELNLTNIKFLFLKSQIDYLYHKINSLSTRIYEFLIDFKNFLSLEFKSRKRRRLKPDDNCYIGISVPGSYDDSIDLISVTNQLERENIKYNYIRGIYDIAPTFKNMKFKWALFCHLKFNFNRLFEKSNKKNEIIRYIRPSLKEYTLACLKDIFFNELIRIIYVIEAYSNVIESSDYKVIIILNEFGEIGKITNYLGNKYGIQIYFIPYCGIPRRESDVTPHLSDIICVYGELDKIYLTEKGVNSDKILIRGSPKYDSVMRKSFQYLTQLKDHFTGRIHVISDKKKKILLTTNPISNKSNRVILNTVTNVVKKLRGVQLIVKLHPNQNGFFIRNTLKELNCNVIIIKDVDIFKILKTADLVLINPESSVILDSMIIGTPVVLLDFTNKRLYFSAKNPCYNEKYLRITKNEEQLYQILKDLISSNLKLEEYKNSIKRNLNLFNYRKNNYSSSQQIVSDLKNFLKANN